MMLLQELHFVAILCILHVHARLDLVMFSYYVCRNVATSIFKNNNVQVNNDKIRNNKMMLKVKVQLHVVVL